MARIIYEKPDVLPVLTEIFRELGYEGASFGQITERTKISKGSLYNFFPGGKEQMAAEILAGIEAWFVEAIYQPLERDAPEAALRHMWVMADEYFRSGQRVCLVGVFALDATRDRFAKAISGYFAKWIASLSQCLMRAGLGAAETKAVAEDIVLGIQGALVLARALNDEGIFSRALQRMADSTAQKIAKI